VSQIEKECTTWDETLERYLAVVRRMENFFKGFTMEHIERAKNTDAYELAKAMARKEALPSDVFFPVIEVPSVKTVEPEPKNGKCRARRRLASTGYGILPSQL
jgi:hypothetical protein